MNLCIVGLKRDYLENWPRFESEKLIGYITIYLYDKDKKRGEPVQLTYNFNVRKVNDELVMYVTTKFNAYYKENAKLLEDYGFTDMHENISKGYYKINLEKIIGTEGR